MKKKIVTMLLTASMLASLLAGCGSSGNDQPKENTSDTAATDSSEDAEPEVETQGQESAGGLLLPLSEEPAELSVMTVWSSDIYSDPNEAEGVQAAEERTNVHVNFQTYTQTEALERFYTVLNTGEYPDIISVAGTTSYPGGYVQGIEDGVLIDMSEYIQYMPNYMALLESNEEAKKQAAYDDGEIHGIRIIVGTDSEVKAAGPAYGFSYRKDILDEMGEDLPVTIDEWHDLLVKCRDNGMTAACSIESDGGSLLSLAWGVNTDWSSKYFQYDYKTGKVDFAPLMEGFGEYLETMRQWYAEGLIDKNFTAGNYLILNDYTNIQNNQNMLLTTWFGFAAGTFLSDTGAVSNPDVYIAAAPGVVLNEGDSVIGCNGSAPIAQEIYVTTACEDPVLAAKWLDYQFSQEGIIYRYYGIEGKSYERDENGELVYTEAVTNSPDGLSPSQAIQAYAINAIMGFQDEEAGEKLSAATSVGDSVLVECKNIWSEMDTNIAMSPGITLSVEEEEILNQYFTDINTAVQEHMVKYIIGEDDTTQEEFVEVLKSYGVEEVLAAYQSAADRYNSR